MNKNKTILIIGIIMVAIVLTITGTYAYWTITKSQSTNNTLIGGCLNIELTEEGAGINLEKAWPISDFEGMQLEGYTFSVTNLCDEPQDYRIDLDRLEESAGAKEMSNEYLATLLDYGAPVVYSDLESYETTEDGVKEKRIIAYDTVMGGETNEHTLRLWIDEESPVSEQGSTFLSKVKINAGQGIEKYYTPEECFTFDAENGSITGYDETKAGCTTDVVIPYEITPADANDAVAVTQIGNNAFLEKEITSVEFPRTVTKIGEGAFRENPTIEKITFRDGLISIGRRSFWNKESIGKLEFAMFPNTLETILGVCFANNSLKQVIIPDSVSTLNGSVFTNNQIQNIKIGTSLNMIDINMFSRNDIKEVIIPDNITTIGNAAFENNHIEKLVIGKNVTTLGNAVFNFNEIREIVLPDSLVSIGVATFQYNPIEKITFGKNVTTIGGDAFSNYSSGTDSSETGKYKNKNFLTEIYVPANIINIGNGVFLSATSDVIISTERTKEDFLTNVSAGTTPNYEWYGNAQVISSDGLLIYE